MKQKSVLELDEEATQNYLKMLEPIHQHCADTNCVSMGSYQWYQWGRRI